jgi:LacI family transcriptional regulator, repressor for deo operon, udp, cdd, tsx, nupC, and nupG
MVATRRRTNARVTIADVAREAGVNKGTVSRALRGVSGVGDSTRERILEAADRLNFSASHIATALATGQSQTVGIVLPNLKSWYFGEVADGASQVLIPAGFRVELINLNLYYDYLDVDSQDFRRLVSELGQGRGRDALLFAGNVADAERDNTTGTARVPVSAPGLPLTSVPGVFIDNRRGARLVAEHLVALGHRRIAVLDGRLPDTGDTRLWTQRTQGIREGLRAAGLELAEDLIVYGGDCHGEHGEAAIATLLERTSSSSSGLPSAIFCHTDEMAFGAIAALRRAGIRCPEDISVAGFDDHAMSAYWGLTTVTQHAHEQGARAARALLAGLNEDLDGALGAADMPVLTEQLVARETTRAV